MNKITYLILTMLIPCALECMDKSPTFSLKPHAGTPNPCLPDLLSGDTLKKITPIIVDHNAGQSIKTEVGTRPTIIGVFGATPRLSAFECYVESLKSHCNDLLNLHNKNKRLKGVAPSVKNFVKAIEPSPGLEKLNTVINHATNRQLMDLFFAAGFDHKTLADNITRLITTAERELQEKRSVNNDQPESLALAHIFMPSYFTGLANLKDNPNASNIVHTLLKHAAEFYKNLYTKVDASATPLTVYIIIPNIRYFMDAIQQGAAVDKLNANLQVVEEELIEKAGVAHGYMLMDQDTKELKPMVDMLHAKGIKKVGGVGIAITNSKGYPTTIFNPYIISRDSKQTYQTSPLFNEQLIEYAQNNHEERI